ncbi:MAG: TetR/AcrR family transcriptional regulator [Halanaerobium sp.]
MSTDTKDVIINSAVRLFSEKNYHAVSMSQIADAADLSKGTLYWHFESKEELFREILIKGIDYFDKNFRRILKYEGDFENKIYDLIDFVIDSYIENINILILIQNNLRLIDKELENQLSQKNQDFINIISQFIEKAIDEGIVVRQDPSDLALMILSILFSDQVKKMLINCDEQKEQKETKDFIYNFIMYGIKRKENN